MTGALVPNDHLTTVLIVLSTGRTGTKALAHYFNVAYDQVTALHEPKPSRYLRTLSNRSIAGKLTRQQRVRSLARSRRRIIGSITRPVYIESNWYIYGFVDVLKDVFGAETKLLHVVRDPRTYIPSHLNYGTISGYKRVFTTVVPYWYLRPEQLDPNAPKRWNQMADEERMAFHWQIANREIDKAKDAFGADYRLMKYEDFYDPSGAGINQILDWIDLPRSEKLLEQIRTQRVHASPNRGYKKWKDWPAELQRSVLDMLGPQMRRYGYEA
jgi:hypothetical protein